MAIAPVIGLLIGVFAPASAMPAPPEPAAPFALSNASWKIAAPKGYWTSNYSTVALSPDGSQIAFCVIGLNRETQIAIVSTKRGSTARILPGTNGGANPFWSPDGMRIGFFHDRKELWTIDRDGKSSRLVCECPGSTGTWSPSGTILFSSAEGTLVAVSEDGKAPPRAVTSLDQSAQEVSHTAPRFLPDGKHFLFAVQQRARVGPGMDVRHPYPLSIYEASVDEEGRVLITVDGTEAAPLDSTTIACRSQDGILKTMSLVSRTSLLVLDHDARHFDAVKTGAYVRTPRTQLSNLVWVDRQGTLLGVVDSKGTFSRPRISPDGTLIAYDDGTNLVVRNAETNRIVATFRSGHIGIAWSRDSRSIAAPLMIGEKCAIAIADVVSGSVRPVSTSCSQLFDWSADGRYLAVEGYARFGTDFTFIDLEDPAHSHSRSLVPNDEGLSMTISVGGDGVVRHDPRPEPAEWWQGWLRFAPGGSAAAFDATRHGPRSGTAEGDYHVYVTALPSPIQRTDKGGGSMSLSPTGGYRPAWRADGQELFFVDGESHMMSIRTTPSGNVVEPLFVIPRGNMPFVEYDVSADGNRFLMAREIDTGLYFVAAAKPKQVAPRSQKRNAERRTQN